MTTAGTPPAPTLTARPRRRRRWLRWTMAGIAGLAALIVGLVVAAVKLQPVTVPPALPAGVTAPVGPVDGTYQPGSGSMAGFRIRQSVIGLTSDVVGRTDDITGTVTIAGGRATAAAL